MKKHSLTNLAIIFTLLFSGCKIHTDKHLPLTRVSTIPVPGIEFQPQTYVCFRSGELDIDGVISDQDWEQAEWTNNFVDIEGDIKPPPLYQTRVKMLWDNDYLYIAAELKEPHIQARLLQRDTVIFYDNDFEVFIDPDGDTHGYYELELNAFNTVWDLLLTKPYRDPGNRVIDSWDISGLKSAVKIYGSLNDPTDTDEKWTVEIAIPFKVLSEWGNKPGDGTQWRINFSRVNWKWEIINGTYRKAVDLSTGKNHPESNWVWSPQGLINMHYPEMWGYLQFTDTMAGEASIEFKKDGDEEIKWDLRQLYYSQRIYAAEKGVYGTFISDINKHLNCKLDKNIKIIITPSGYEAYLKSESSGLTWVICSDGRIFYLSD